jgi:hypothetical protein
MPNLLENSLFDPGLTSQFRSARALEICKKTVQLTCGRDHSGFEHSRTPAGSSVDSCQAEV